MRLPCFGPDFAIGTPGAGARTALKTRGTGYRRAMTAETEGAGLDRRGLRLTPARALSVATILAFWFVAIRAGLAPEPALDRLARSDNDDIMRMLSLRDWLAGQGWFDMSQTRVLPPEGLSLHWSRYVDLALAAILWPLSLVLPMELAETAVLILWPTLLLLILIRATARAGAAALGPVPALIAILMILFWPVTDQSYFRVARIDHHNVQIVLTSLMLFGLIVPGPRVRSAIGAGFAAALSLAIGLEALVLVALAGIVLCIRALLDPDRDGPPFLAFATALAGAATLLHLGQTAPADWSAAACDRLSLPFLALTWTGAATAFALHLAAPRGSRPATRLALAAVVGAAGLAATWPVLGPCLSGPYGALPGDVQALITTRITEARPAHAFALEGSASFYRFVAPHLAAVAIASLLFLRRRAAGRAGAGERRAVATLLIFGWVALAGSFLQIRMIVLAAPALPLLTGYVLWALHEARTRAPGAPLPTLVFLGGAATTLLLPTLWALLAPLLAPPASAAVTPNLETRSPSHCRAPDTLRALNALESGTVLTWVNLGAPILLLTGNSVAAAPYHRSADALANGVFPFERDEAYFRRALADTGADYVLLCTGARYGDGTSFIDGVAAGGVSPAGLTRIPGLPETLMVFRVEDPR